MKTLPLVIRALPKADQDNYLKGLGFRILDGVFLSVSSLISVIAFMAVDRAPLTIILAVLIPISVVIFLFRYAVGVGALKRCYAVTYRGGVVLRRRVLAHLTRLPLAQLSKFGAGRTAQILSEDVMWMENHAGFFRPAALSDLAAVGVLYLGVLLINWPAALAAICIWVVGYVILRRVRIGIARGLAFRSAGLTEASRHFVEYAEGIQVIRAFGTNSVAEGAIQGQSERMRHGFRKSILRFTPVMGMIQGLAFVAVAAGTFVAVLSGGETSRVVGVVFLLAATLVPIRSIIAGGTLTSLAKIGETNIAGLEAEPEVKAGKVIAFANEAEVIFDNVSFAYQPDQLTLQGISFTAQPGTITAFVGPSGAGKTTLVNLLLRFADYDSGTIRMNGTDIQEYSMESYSTHFAAVFQDTILFRDTLKNNIRIGRPDATEAEIIDAAKAAQIHETIMTLPNGYDEVVGHSGQTLSGGERQRVTIARAILKDAAVVILDEATSALDPENEREIQMSFEALVQGKTVFIIAHRLSTITEADNICMLNEGRIEAQGTHEELMSKSESYRSLWKSYIAVQNWQL